MEPTTGVVAVIVAIVGTGFARCIGSFVTDSKKQARPLPSYGAT